MSVPIVRLCARHATALGLLFASVAQAQVVNKAVLVATPTQTGGDNQEVVIASTAYRPHEVTVAWQRLDQNTESKIWYAVSLSNGVSFSAPDLAFPSCATLVDVQCCSEHHFDPMIGYSRVSGDTWIGCATFIASPNGQTLLVARRPQGQTFLTNHVQAIPCSSTDKPFMAVGPWPGESTPPAEAVYVAWHPFPQGHLRTARAQDVYPTGSAWELTPGQPGAPTVVTSAVGGGARLGVGSFPVVIHDGPFVGRLLHASVLNVNTVVPEVTFSDVGGGGSAGDWSQHELLERVQPGSTAIPIRAVNKSPDPNNTNAIPIPGYIHANSMPGMASDPTNPQNVLVAFAGRVDEPGFDPDNLDIFIAWGQRAGNRLPFESRGFRYQDIVRLDDSLLRAPSDPNPDVASDEWHPSVSIDGYGA